MDRIRQKYGSEFIADKRPAIANGLVILVATSLGSNYHIPHFIS